MSATTQDREYVLGTHEEEVARLALQHRVWRPRALDAWRRAGFTLGQTILDIGCGPGHASLDLAELVGPDGRIIAVDASRRFLDALEKARRHRGLPHIESHALDLDQENLPKVDAHGAWCRWVFSFVRQPRRLLEQARAALRPGGVLVLHEYFDYATWRSAPRKPEVEEFVAAVMKSWRADGGEPDIALHLLPWLTQLGFEVRSLQPIVDVVTPASHTWHWPKTFVFVGLQRLVSLGHVTKDRAAQISRSFEELEAIPGAHLFTPAVLEIIAIRK